MSDNWSPCPRCGSNRVQVKSKIEMFSAFIKLSIVLFLCGIFSVLFLWLIPIAMIIAVVLLFTKKSYECQDCKYWWDDKKSK